MKRQRLSLKERIDKRVAESRGVDVSELEPLGFISERLEESRRRQEELNARLAALRQQTKDRRARAQGRRRSPARSYSQPAIKAIETHYKGYRFRSRLEARWAVALTAEGIRWEYEAEGFELPSGRYLPDFWLPDLQMWAEVKPAKLSAREEALGDELARGTGFPVLLLIAVPEAKHYRAFSPSGAWSRKALAIGLQAVAAARAARFEHGESPV